MAKPIHALVVYFSRSGQTEKLAREIQKMLPASKIEEIREIRSRKGVLGYLQSAFEAMVGSSPVIEPLETDPSHFDVVVLACPVWMSRIASPMRTYLLKMESKLPRVAFTVTEGGSGGNRALLQMRDLCRKIPLAELVVTETDLTKKFPTDSLKLFCQNIQDRFERETHAVVEPEPKKAARP